MIKDGIVIIGAGKLAYSLTSALLDAGYSVQSIISRKLSSAKSLAKKFSVPHYSKSLNIIPPEIKIFFFTVPDGEIKKVAESLSKLKRNYKNCICIHFSGVEDISALKSLSKKGCAVGSLHIIRPFPSKNIVDLKNFPASIESEDKRVNS
ncbi:MAG: NAD(P)-binding domain-containing protein, partial [Ignavibacteriaceae bacterium]|nr:NAD(P)-binding domain-containing protein [Ignavibacteriaceae bacterium]